MAAYVVDVNRRRALALALGALFIWWGLQGAFLVESVGALWFGMTLGGFIAALGAATTGYDGIVEAVIALGVVLALASVGLVVLSLFRYGLASVDLLGETADIVSMGIVARQMFLVPLLMGGGAGGFVNGRYLPAPSR